MDETWISLLSGVVGAVVGGAASLAGTVLVNRMQMAAHARLRLYDELLPKFADAERRLLAARGQQPIEVLTRKDLNRAAIIEANEVLGAIRRASAIAGRHERRYAEQMRVEWDSVTSSATAILITILDEMPDLRAVAEREKNKEVFDHRKILHEAIDSFSKHLAAKLG